MAAGAGVEQQADRVAGRLARARTELAELERSVDEKRSQIVHLERRQHAWSCGGEGERLVGSALDAMVAEGWQVLHDVHWPGRPRANLDHVVVGPGGVVVVDTKNWSADVTVRSGVLRAGGSSREREIQAALAQGAAVAALLPAPFRSTVSSLICFVRQDLHVHSLRGVAIVSLVELRGHLLTLPAVLGPPDVAAVAALLRRRLTGAQSPPRLTTGDTVGAAGTSSPPGPAGGTGSHRRTRRGRRSCPRASRCDPGC